MKIGNCLVFLSGSGISIPAELPSTNQLTEAVLAGDSYDVHSHESFSIFSFLRLLRDTVEKEVLWTY
jgi:hypothetical protein